MVSIVNAANNANQTIKINWDDFKQNCPYTSEEIEKNLTREHEIAQKEAIKSDSNRQGNASKERIIETICMQNLNVFKEQKEDYTALYTIQQATNAETLGDDDKKVATARICQEQNSEQLYLSVKFEEPNDFSLEIFPDGNVEIVSPNDKVLTAEQYEAALSYMKRRGLKPSKEEYTLESPLGLNDEQAKKNFEQAKNNFEQAKNNLERRKLELEDTASQLATAYNINIDDCPALKNMSSIVKEPDCDEALKSLRKWMDKNKVRNLSYFERNINGGIEFTVFDEENPDNMDLDGKYDKNTGDIKVRHKCKIRIQKTKDNKLSISFTGKTIDDNFADRIMDGFKDAGLTRVFFHNLGGDGNEAVMRSACGRALIVPVGLKLSATKLDKMIQAAEGKKGKDSDLIVNYRYELARQYAFQLFCKNPRKIWNEEKNANDAECQWVRNAYDAYKFTPFYNLWENKNLSGHYESIINKWKGNKEQGASQVLGARKAIAVFFESFQNAVNNPDGNLKYMLSKECKGLSNKEKENIKKAFEERNINIDGISLRNMPLNVATIMFDEIQKNQAIEVEKQIKEEYYTYKSGTQFRGDASSKAIAQVASSVSQMCQNVNNELKRCGVKEITILDVGNNLKQNMVSYSREEVLWWKENSRNS